MNGGTKNTFTKNVLTSPCKIFFVKFILFVLTKKNALLLQIIFQLKNVRKTILKTMTDCAHPYHY